MCRRADAPEIDSGLRMCHVTAETPGEHVSSVFPSTIPPGSTVHSWSSESAPGGNCLARAKGIGGTSDTRLVS